MIRLKSLISILGLYLLLSLYPLSGAVAQELDMPNAAYPIEHVVVGGQPSQADFETLKAAGVTVIVNLRTAGEFDDFDEQAVVESLGMTYVNIPVFGMGDVGDDTAAAINAVLAHAEGDVVIHCAAGARAGLALAYAEYKAGHVTAEEAVALAGDAHMESIEPYMVRLLEENGG